MSLQVEADSTTKRDKYGFVLDPQLAQEEAYWRKEMRKKVEVRNKRWIEYFSNDRMGADAKMTQLRKLVRQGIIANRRAELWQISTMARDKLEANKYYYSEMQKKHRGKESWAIQEIEKDLEHTFPGHKVLDSPEGRNTLKRILATYSWRNEDVGYCSGMNLMAAMLALFMPEEEAFWMLCTVVEELNRDYYGKNMVGNLVDQRVFFALMEQKLPKVYQHFKKLRVQIALISTPWFLSLFVGELPTETVLRVWDCFFYDGSVVLFRVGLAILMMCERHILSARQTADVITVIRTTARRMFDADGLLNVAYDQIGDLGTTKLETSKNRIENLREFFKTQVATELEDVKSRREVHQLANDTYFNKDELEQLREEFRQIAPDGYISFENFKEVMTRVAPWYKRNAFAMDRVFKAFDKNGDGHIEFRELSCGLSILTKGSQDEKLRLAFESFDLDSSGYIEKDEMELLLDSLYKMFYEESPVEDLGEYVDLIFDNVDINPRDGRLSFEEFKSATLIEPLILQCFSLTDDRSVAAEYQLRQNFIDQARGADDAGGGGDFHGGPSAASWGAYEEDGFRDTPTGDFRRNAAPESSWAPPAQQQQQQQSGRGNGYAVAAGSWAPPSGQSRQYAEHQRSVEARATQRYASRGRSGSGAGALDGPPPPHASPQQHAEAPHEYQSHHGVYPEYTQGGGGGGGGGGGPTGGRGGTAPRGGAGGAQTPWEELDEFGNPVGQRRGCQCPMM